MNACHETIYQAIYVQSKGRLRRDIEGKLRSGRAARRPRSAGDERKPRFRDPMVMISERPAEVEDRAVPGHWEGDLITGAANKSAIGTLVERTTRFTILLHLPDGHGAEQVQDAIVKKMARLPELMLNSLAWDQGSELARHKKIGAALCFCQAIDEHSGMLTFFRADPYAASPKDCLYCTGLIPPSDSFIRPSLYQWM